jgi:rare lipoprotein A
MKPCLHSTVTLLLLGALSCAGKPAPATLPAVSPVSVGYTEQGIASWYGAKYHGRATASGERYDMHAMTAAHPTLPFGVVVEVTNLKNDRHVRVRINDRGPFRKGRIIDLSYAAARKLGMVHQGLAEVRVRVVDPGPSPPR